MPHLAQVIGKGEALSRLKINLEKNELIPIGRVTNADLLADVLGCEVGSLSSSSLGMLLGVRFNFEIAWDRVEERFRKRLALLKRQYISKGGGIQALCRAFLFISCLFSPCQERLNLDFIRFGETFYWKVVLWSRNHI